MWVRCDIDGKNKRDDERQSPRDDYQERLVEELLPRLPSVKLLDAPPKLLEELRRPPAQKSANPRKKPRPSDTASHLSAQSCPVTCAKQTLSSGVGERRNASPTLESQSRNVTSRGTS